VLIRLWLNPPGVAVMTFGLAQRAIDVADLAAAQNPMK